MSSADVKNTPQNSKPKYLRSQPKGKPKRSDFDLSQININKSQISKLRRRKAKVIAAAADRKVKKLTKI